MSGTVNVPYLVFIHYGVANFQACDWLVIVSLMGLIGLE